MANTDHPVRIPLKENEALRLLGKVKPTADMPRPEAKPQTKKRNKSKTEAQ